MLIKEVKYLIANFTLELLINSGIVGLVHTTKKYSGMVRSAKKRTDFNL